MLSVILPYGPAHDPRRIATTVALLALAAPVATTLTAAPATAVAGKYYSSCSKLARDFPHGVAKSRAAAQRQVREGYAAPAYGKKVRAVYVRNLSRLDRDGDGTACER